MRLRITRLSSIANSLAQLFSPSKLFMANEQGVWYDPSDFDRYMAPLGPELVTNGDFSNGTTGWTAGANTAISSPNQNIRVSNTSTAYGYARTPITTVIGKTYVLTGDFTKGTSSFAGIGAGVSTNGSNTLGAISVSASGQFRLIFTASTTTTYINIGNDNASGAYSDFDNISVRELTAIDTATLFQDSAGTTPVTAVEQPVGLMLDKSKGLVLGSELVTNGDFSGGTTGWQLISAAVSITGGAFVFDGATSITASTVAAVGAAPSGQVTAGRWYKVTYTILSSTTLPISVGFQNNTGTLRTDAGTYSEYILAANTGDRVAVWARGTTGARTGSIDNISVRELPGNHAFQATSTSRPVLSARYNLLTKTEQFDDAAWAKSNAAVASNASVAPDGTLTADGIIGNSGATTNTGAYQSNSENAVKTISVYAKAGQKTWLRLFGTNLTFGAYFNLSTGVVGTLVGSPVGAAISDAGNGWYRCSLTFNHTTGATSQFVGFYFTNGDNTNASSGDGVTVLGSVWGADLRVTNDAAGQPTYQRVNTATDYDTAGFKPYLRFDGTDDWMQTNSVDFTATDKMTVFAGVRKLSDAVAGMVFETSFNRELNPGTISLIAPNNGGQPNIGFVSKGTVQVSISPTGYAAPITTALTGLGDISGDSAILRVNGTQVASSTADQGTGTYGNYPLYIGRRGSTTAQLFNGRIYGLIVRGAQSTTQQITSTENWLNQRTGAY